MCLITKQILPIRARKDIVVYKVLEVHRSHVYGKTFRTPYRWTPVTLHTTLYARGNVYKKRIPSLESLKYEVGRGYIHCYTSMRALRKYNIYGGSTTAVKCIIRKGTLYYKSYDDIEICATQVDVLCEIA